MACAVSVRARAIRYVYADTSSQSAVLALCGLLLFVEMVAVEVVVVAVLYPVYGIHCSAAAA